MVERSKSSNEEEMEEVSLFLNWLVFILYLVLICA